MERPQSPSPAKPGVPVPAVPVLPRSVQQLVGRLRPEDSDLIEALMCRLPTTREMVSVARFWDDIYERAKTAEHWISGNRIKGAEFDAYYDRWKKAMEEVIRIGIELGRRANLVSVFQEHRRLLAHFDYQPNGLKFGEDASRKKKGPPVGGKPANLPPAVAASAAAPASPALAAAS